MNIITISKKRFSHLMPLTLSREILNAESTVYDFSYRGKHKILKELQTLSGPIFGTKLYTVEMLDTYREFLPENFYIPDNLVSINSVISGFTAPFAEGTNLATVLQSNDVSLTEQIHYLKQIGGILDQLKLIRKYTPVKEFYLNDIHESNFIANTKTKSLYVIDLDGCKIADNLPLAARYLSPFALLNSGERKYKINRNGEVSGHIVADENSDLYCYNIIILNYLYGSSVNNMNIADFYDYLSYLSNIGMEKDLINSFKSLLHAGKNHNPVSELDSITKDQFVLAKKAAYQLTKKTS